MYYYYYYYTQIMIHFLFFIRLSSAHVLPCYFPIEPHRVCISVHIFSIKAMDDYDCIL